jgi:(2Fe-2S) ferredoxin
MEKHILICTNRRLTGQSPSCGGSDAESLALRLEQLIAERGLKIGIERGTCLGRCTDGPTLRFIPGGEFFTNLSPEQLPQLIDKLEAFVAGL